MKRERHELFGGNRKGQNFLCNISQKQKNNVIYILKGNALIKIPKERKTQKFGSVSLEQGVGYISFVFLNYMQLIAPLLPTFGSLHACNQKAAANC